MADDTVGRTDVAHKMVPAPPQAVYQALTQPDLLMRWLPPAGMSGRVELFEPFEGGRYRYVLRYDDAGLGAGKTSADEDAVEGRFTELVPAARVVQTARFQSDDPAFAGEMRSIWTLEPSDNGTRVTIRCENVPPGISAEAHAEGLGSTLANLAALFDGGG